MFRRKQNQVIQSIDSNNAQIMAIAQTMKTYQFQGADAQMVHHIGFMIEQLAASMQADCARLQK